MPQRILVPFDTSDSSSEALEVALTQYPDSEIIALHVLHPAESQCGSMRTATGLSIQAWDCAEELLQEAEQKAGESHSILTTTIEVGQPTEEIVNYAQKQDLDCIVMGSQNYVGLSRLLLGSMAKTVARRSPVPVRII